MWGVRADSAAATRPGVQLRSDSRVDALVEERLDQLASLTELAVAVARAESVDDACSAALDCVAHTLSPERASVLLFDARGVIRFTAWRGLSNDYRRATEGHSPWSTDTTDPEPVLVPDVRSEPSLAALREVIECEGIRALGFFPLLDRGRLLGKFTVYFDEPHAFTETEVGLAEAIGAHVALEIARSRREAESAFLVEASRVLGESLDFRVTLRRLAELSVPFLADHCAIELAGNDALERDARAVIASGEPAIRDDEGRSVMIVPLRSSGRTLGVMRFVATGGHRRYGEHDLRYASDLAHRAALATENGRMHERERRVRGAGEVLQHVTEALAPTLTVAEVVAVLVREAPTALDAAASWIAEVDPESGELHRLGSGGHSEHLASRHARLSFDLDTPTVRAARTRRPLWYESAAHVKRAYPLLAADYEATGFEAMAVVPLIVAGRTTGVIALNFLEKRSFREDEKRLLVALADQCGQALERARLHAEVQDRADAASALDHVADGVFLLGADERVMLWNQGAAVITGIDEDEALNRPIGELILDWAAIREGITITDVPLAFGRRDAVPAQVGDRELWLVISGVTAGEGVVYAFRDVTESERLEKARRDFLATASHELRTPLSGVFGAAKTLLNRELDDGTRRALLKVIDDQADRLAQILDELLFASRLDAGLIDVVLNDCALEPLIDDVVLLQRSRLPAGHTLTTNLAPGLPPVRCDQERLRQVLLNLIDNAIKYSPDGGAITVSAADVGGAVLISVADPGLGIPAAERERIFEKFYRLDPGLRRGVGGTGLGLYISRQYIHQMRGRVWVEPRQGRGSTFHIELLAARPS
jgi:signal transduction histidine kinase